MALRVNPSNGAKTEFGRSVFAHTSAITVIVDDEPIFNPETAREMIAEMEEDAKGIDAQGRFANETDRETVRTIYRDAVAGLRNRLKQTNR